MLMSSSNGTKGAASFPPPNEGDYVTCRSTGKSYQVMSIVPSNPIRVKLISVGRGHDNRFVRDMVSLDLIWEFYIPTWR